MRSGVVDTLEAKSWADYACAGLLIAWVAACDLVIDWRIRRARRARARGAQ